MVRSRATGLVALLLLGGCEGAVSASFGDTPVIPLGAAVALEETCIDLEPGERVLDIGPEGDAWIATSTGVRAVSATGVEHPAIALRAGAPDVALALSETEALVIAAHNVFRVGAGAVEPIEIAPELGDPLRLCGDPASPGPVFLATTAGLHAREGGSWVRWVRDGAPLLAPGELGHESGACTDASDELWWRDDDGVVLARSDASELARVVALQGADALSRDADTIAAIRDGNLLVRTEEGWDEVRLDVGAVAAIASGGGRVWSIAGGELALRDRDGRWARIDTLPGLRTIRADTAGGAWVASATRACRLTTGPELRVRGLRPHQVMPGTSALRFEAEAGTRIDVRVDGELAWQAGASEDGAWETPVLALGDPGWHRLEAVAQIGPEQTVRRGVEYRVIETLSWEHDIRPDFEAHCAECHSEPDGTRAYLGSVDAYRTRSLVIRDRMARGDMPPSPRPAVPAEVIERMQQWIGGGMQP